MPCMTVSDRPTTVGERQFRKCRARTIPTSTPLPSDSSLYNSVPLITLHYLRTRVHLSDVVPNEPSINPCPTSDRLLSFTHLSNSSSVWAVVQRQGALLVCGQACTGSNLPGLAGMLCIPLLPTCTQGGTRPTRLTSRRARPGKSNLF
jgi:hypothetical protein